MPIPQTLYTQDYRKSKFKKNIESNFVQSSKTNSTTGEYCLALSLPELVMETLR